MKRCGNCNHFIKIRHREHLPGICGKHDWSCSENYGRKCQDHKPKKFDRVESKRITAICV